MGFIYILGLEHSGTTLLDQLISSNESITGLGEVQHYLSAPKRQDYLRKWQTYPDHNLCSCGCSWSDCELWGSVSEELISDGEQTTRSYSGVLARARELYGDNHWLVDSSKSTEGLRFLENNRRELGLGESDLYLIHIVKDIREFLASQIAKDSTRANMLNLYRTSNYWHSVSQQQLNYFEQTTLAKKRVSYQSVCQNTQALVESIWSNIGLASGQACTPNHCSSHIVLGNKNFLNQNRTSVTYDERWKRNRKIKLVHQLNRKSHRLNARLQSAAQL